MPLVQHPRQEATPSSVDAVEKSQQPANKEANRKAQLRGKDLADQDRLLEPDWDAKPAAQAERRDKHGGDKKKPEAASQQAAQASQASQASQATQQTPAVAYPPDVQALLQRWPEGIAMTFYTDYEEGVSGKREFVGRATEQSLAIGAAAKKGGKVELGKTHAIRSQWEIAEHVNALVGYLQSVLSPEDLAAGRHKLAQLHIYGHGYASGISTGGHHKGKKRADMSTKSVGDFVGAVAGSLRGDVNVALMACNTGKDVKGKEGGEGSFADALRD